jgi:hypothetical protein
LSSYGKRKREEKDLDLACKKGRRESDRAEIFRAKPTPAGPEGIGNHLLIDELGQAFSTKALLGQVNNVGYIMILEH